MGFNNLLGNAETKAGMRAKFLAFWPFAVETIENRRQFVFRYALTVIVDNQANAEIVRIHRNVYNAVRRRERKRIGDQIL